MAHFSDAERSELSILLSKRYSNRQIGISLGRNHRTIDREIRRNSSNGRYDPGFAKVKARTRRKHSKYQGMKIHERSDLESYVVEKLKEHWTPEQISGRIREVDTHIPYVSAKGIYK